ncbi:MAG TPA: hypothetical protein VF604_19465 [Pyrinomonadaceae bacterium]|jgi:hypothetical protein
MAGKNQDKIKTLLAQIGASLNDNEEQAETDDAAAKKILTVVQILENAAELSLQISRTEHLAALKAEDLPQFVSILSETAEKLFDFYRTAIKHLPPEAIEGLTVKLKVSKSLLTAELEASAGEIGLYADEIAEIQKQKLEKERELGEKIANVDQGFQRVRILEDTLRLYAESNHRALNSLPRRLNEANAKLEVVEKLLGEVDEDTRKLLEEHQRAQSVIRVVEA